MTGSLVRAITAEVLGTGLLLAVVVGSGIMGERLAGGNAALALLANSAATACGLFVLILMFAPLSGAHFNPLVSVLARIEGVLTSKELACFVAAQVAGALSGVALAHAMFDLAWWVPSQHARTGAGQWLAEGVATFGLIFVILGARRYGVVTLAAAIAAFIAGAYWFTASTSFANPAVTIARSLTPTFAGIAPSGVGGFILAQICGAALAVVVGGRLFDRRPPA